MKDYKWIPYEDKEEKGMRRVKKNRREKKEYKELMKEVTPIIPKPNFLKNLYDWGKRLIKQYFPPKLKDPTSFSVKGCDDCPMLAWDNCDNLLCRHPYTTLTMQDMPEEAYDYKRGRMSPIPKKCPLRQNYLQIQLKIK
jgi:hypothetical protein